MTLSDRIAVMNAGQLEQVGPPSEVYERPATSFVRDFLGRALILEGVVRRDGSREWLTLAGEDGHSLVFPAGQLADLTDGRVVAVACRPEDVQVEEIAAPTPNRIPATVEDAAYLGERMEYSVRTQSGRLFVVFSSRRERYAIGARVDLVIQPGDATLWPQ